MTALLAAATVPAGAASPPGPVSISMQCSGPGLGGAVAPGQTDNCGVYLTDGTLASGSSVQMTVSSPPVTMLFCQSGRQTGTACTFDVAGPLVGHAFIGGERLQFAGPGTVTATARVCTDGGCSSLSTPVIGPGAFVTGVRPRTFPTAPYAYATCAGPNPDGTVSQTQVDTCLVYLTGGGGPFISGDHLQIARREAVSPLSVTSCSGSGVATAATATTSNLCDYRFTSLVGGSGVFVGAERIDIPNTVETGTAINLVAFYCSVLQQGLPRFCPDVPVAIAVTGPGAVVTDEIPPMFTSVPSDVTVDATGPADTVVTFDSPTATDNAPGTVSIACTPGPGAMFPVGKTPVTCTATDVSGNSAAASFEVAVEDSFDSLCRVTGRVVTNKGVAHSLCVKLEGAADAETVGNLSARDGKLGAFMNEVDAQSDKTLTAQQAQDLAGLAQLLMT